MKILIIDDDVDITTILRLALQKFGYTPLTALDGIRGLEILQAHPDIRLVLLDWMLPGNTGADLLKSICGIEAPPPVIVISARSNKEDVVAAIKAGASDYQVKPIHIGRLIQRIQDLTQAAIPPEESQQSHEHYQINMPAFTTTSIVDISTTGIAFVTNFPVERDAVVFLESDELIQRIGLPEGDSLPVRVANCVKAGNRYRVGAQFIHLPKEAEEHLKKLCQS